MHGLGRLGKSLLVDHSTMRTGRSYSPRHARFELLLAVHDARSPASCNPGSHVIALRCTSRQHNDHITETRELRYRWHCWYGRTVYIFGTFARVGQPAYRCALEIDADRLLEIPQWMFDAGACCGMVMVEKASVSIEALFDLKCLLLRTVEVADQSGVLQDEHPKMPETGGAHAKPKGSKGVRPVDIFPSVATDATVARPTARGTRRNAKSACPTASNTSPRSTGRKGGVR